MTSGERQHYVPRTYLRNFSGSKDQIQVYDIRRRRKFATNITNVAVERDFYEMPDSFDAHEVFSKLGGTSYVERWFGKVESGFAPLLDEVRKRAQSCYQIKGLYPSIKYEWRVDLAFFMYLQYMRTREQRRRHQDLFEKAQTAMARLGFEMNGKYEEFGLEPEDIQVKMTNEAINASHIALMLDPHVLGKVVETWSEQWCFYIMRTNVLNPFFASDSPVVRHNYSNKPPGLLAQGTEFILPLDPLNALVIVDPDIWNDFPNMMRVEDGSLTIVKPEHVMFYNSLQVYQCYAQVYSKRPSFKLVDDIISDYPKIGSDEWDAEMKGFKVNGGV